MIMSSSQQQLARKYPLGELSSSPLARPTRPTYEKFIQTGMRLSAALTATLPKAGFFPRTGDSGRASSTAAEKEFLQAVSHSFQLDGKPARVITSLPEINWRANDERYWIDFAIEYQGQVYPFNFKYGRGESPDNICGMSTMAYLIGNKIEHPLKSQKIPSREKLAELTVEVLYGDMPEEEYPNREYFCLFCDISKAKPADQFKTIAISQLDPASIFVNPSNGIQVKFSEARQVPIVRDRNQSRRFIASCASGYFDKAAQPARIIARGRRSAAQR